jgi:hypothetical protein
MFLHCARQILIDKDPSTQDHHVLHLPELGILAKANHIIEYMCWAEEQEKPKAVGVQRLSNRGLFIEFRTEESGTSKTNEQLKLSFLDLTRHQ